MNLWDFGAGCLSTSVIFLLVWLRVRRWSKKEKMYRRELDTHIHGLTRLRRGEK